MKKLIAVLGAVMFNTMIAVVFSTVTGAEPLMCVGVANGLGLAMGFTPMPQNVFFDPLLREISLAEIRTAFYPDTSWLGRARNFDQYVVADVLKIGDAGADPDVIWNNTTYPIAIKEREDGRLEYSLDNAATENSRIGSIEQMLRVEDYRGDVIRSHRDSLRVACGKRAAHAYAPQANAAKNPVFATSGDSVELLGSNVKAITYKDLLKVKTEFAAHNLFAKGGNLVCLLHPYHQQQLLESDIERFKYLSDLQTGKATRFAGIDFYEYSDMPLFNRSTLVKKAFNAAPENTDSSAVSVFFIDNLVFRADGSYDMFMREKDPEWRGDIVGFQKRFLALPIKAEGIGALVTVSA